MMQKLVLSIFILLISSSAQSLPIGFGMPQADRTYNQSTSPNFHVYHDAETAHEARMIIESLESVHPLLNKWFDIQRKGPLPVISSAMTSNASFANFLTGAIEVQTLGQGQRDLFWHEYVHMMMFLHLENFMGHAGSIFHVPWMPAWFLEGLAEALSVSVNSDRQATIERKQALHDSWPSYDRLHSLYSNSQFFEQGYASSGAFVAWILRKGYAKHKNFLPDLLRRFYKYTLPYYYPISATPITDFLPMDEALRDFLGKKGRELYEEYKIEAKSYWSSHRSESFVDHTNTKETAANTFDRFPIIKSYGNEILSLQSVDLNTISEIKLDFDNDDHLVKARKNTGVMMSAKVFNTILRGDYPIALQTYPDLKTGLQHYQIVFLKEERNSYTYGSLLSERVGQIYNLGESKTKIYWYETREEISRICYINKSDLKFENIPVKDNFVHCPISETLPRNVEIIGAENRPVGSKYFDKDIWYTIHEQTIKGDRQELGIWNPDSETKTPVPFDSHGIALKFVKSAYSSWLLIAERTHRTLMKLDEKNQCAGMLSLEDDVVNLSSTDSDLILSMSLKDASYILRSVDAASLKMKECHKVSAHVSPLLLAMRDPNKEFDQALSDASLWNDEKTEEDVTADPLGSETSKMMLTENTPAEWKPRPILALPWLGANDAKGYQIGTVTIPLMDRMQNESVYATFLYGLTSKYPDTEVNFISSRYWPQLSASLYRKQIWNGTIELEDKSVINSFLDEKGLRLASTLTAYFSPMNITLITGLLTSKRDPYIGPKTTGSQGTLIQPFATLAFTGKLEEMSWVLAMDGLLAPDEWNTRYNYNTLGERLDIKRPLTFLNSKIGLQLEHARTRGEYSKTPILKQAYFPLKTFTPGSGSNYTQNSFPLYGRGSLLEARFGDSKARAELDWSFPVVSNWDKLLWIMYFYELRFSSFVNYGGAWYQSETPTKDFLVAHGYSLDMLFENKGVHFSLGVGIGQVVPGPAQIFLNAGLDLSI